MPVDPPLSQTPEHYLDICTLTALDPSFAQYEPEIFWTSNDKSNPIYIINLKVDIEGVDQIASIVIYPPGGASSPVEMINSFKKLSLIPDRLLISIQPPNATIPLPGKTTIFSWNYLMAAADFAIEVIRGNMPRIFTATISLRVINMITRLPAINRNVIIFVTNSQPIALTMALDWINSTEELVHRAQTIADTHNTTVQFAGKTFLPSKEA